MTTPEPRNIGTAPIALAGDLLVTITVVHDTEEAAIALNSGDIGISLSEEQLLDLANLLSRAGDKERASSAYFWFSRDGERVSITIRDSPVHAGLTFKDQQALQEFTTAIGKAEKVLTD